MTTKQIIIMQLIIINHFSCKRHQEQPHITTRCRTCKILNEGRIRKMFSKLLTEIFLEKTI